MAPFPEQSSPSPPHPYTIFEHVTRPCPDESHFRQQQLSDHTIFVFSIWHGCVGIYRGTGPGEGEEGRADILFTTIHGGERSSRGPCTVTTTRKEVDIIPTYDGSYRWHSMARGLRAALCLVILIFKLPTVFLPMRVHLYARSPLPFPCFRRVDSRWNHCPRRLGWIGGTGVNWFVNVCVGDRGKRAACTLRKDSLFEERCDVL